MGLAAAHDIEHQLKCLPDRSRAGEQQVVQADTAACQVIRIGIVVKVHNDDCVGRLPARSRLLCVAQNFIAERQLARRTRTAQHAHRIQRHAADLQERIQLRKPGRDRRRPRIDGARRDQHLGAMPLLQTGYG